MEFRLQRIALILFTVVVGAAEPESIGVMRKMVLQDAKPYEVGVGAIPTTILMPAPIDAFEGSNISTEPDRPTNVFLQHQPGTRFFSVKAVLPGKADLNVILGDSVYSFHFYFSATPTRTLTIEPAKPAAQRPARTTRITAKRLYEITQDAKTYFLVKDQHPELERAIEVSTPGKVLQFPGYQVVIDRVFRFDQDDTLVFRVVFLNEGAEPRYYRPGEIGLRVGRNVYWPSFAQVSGVMPARQEASIAWDVSPEIVSVVLKGPDGSETDVSNRLVAPVRRTGVHTLVAKAKNGRADTVKFMVSGSGTEPVVVAKGEREFGIRKLTVAPSEPSQTFGWVLYTGTADGQRADLSLQQEFSLVVPTYDRT